MSEAFGLLRFVDDSRAPQCRRSPECGVYGTGFEGDSRVRAAVQGSGPRAFIEIIVIHEFLHALGLGESPPSSQAITEQVAVRCDG